MRRGLAYEVWPVRDWITAPKPEDTTSVFERSWELAYASGHAQQTDQSEADGAQHYQ